MPLVLGPRPQFHRQGNGHAVFIVARGNPVLYEDLVQQFAHEKNVEVILDRRFGERRQRVQAHAFERRRDERRRRVRSIRLPQRSALGDMGGDRRNPLRIVQSMGAMRHEKKGLWEQVRRFINSIDWWVAVKMLAVTLLGAGILTWAVRWWLRF